ncbi:Gfo/Idh/MocA family protein [Georgenia sp. SYP-B2076]|uniref:Gfo/Idh/MocA family protein n=1 Tax=Georgenia sp. SYP-B2076 TaxID=2495881 RepID=UPI000F8F18CE|nr:Gfo/Idh/MocA family oxidoreductase [Georgenia sp. SYP-B2076]
MPTAAIIGCGDVSTIHVEAITAIPGIELVAVCDTDPDVLSAAASANDVPGFADHRQLLEEMHPDVVHICTPHHQHVQVAIDCLAAGVNVIMEKPLAHTRAEGERLVEAAESSRAKIAVCFQNRYNATSQAMRALLDSGELGEVLGASATVMWQRSAEYYRAKPWRGRWETSGGGVLINQAIHTLDLLQWLVGDVTEVRGHAATHLFADVIEVEDTAEMVLTHEGGARSVFYATLGNVVHDPVTLEIVTENATMFLRKDLTVTYADGRTEVVAERAAPSAGRSYWGVSHELLIRDFYDRLADQGPFWISPREASASLRILKEVYAQSGDLIREV